MFERLTALFVKKKKNKGIGSAFSEKLQQSRYKAGHLETGTRKKSFLERWFSPRNPGHRQHSGVPGQKKSGKGLRSIKTVLLSALLLIGSYFLLTGPMKSLYENLHYFRIHEIEISGCRTIKSDDLKKYASLSYEMNLLTLDPREIRRSLLSHPWVKTVKVKRVWPDGLVVSIKEQRPQAIVTLGDEKQFSYINSEGLVFAQLTSGQELDFPVITGIDSFHTEEERKGVLDAANLFLRLAERNNPNLPAQDISEIHFTEKGELILYLVEHPFPIYFGRDGIKRKYYQLCKVLEVMYRKRKGRADIEEVAYIRMDYQKNKVLVVRNHAG